MRFIALEDGRDCSVSGEKAKTDNTKISAINTEAAQVAGKTALVPALSL